MMHSPLPMLPAAQYPCQSIRNHSPLPLTVEQHHIFPIEWQKEIWPEVDRDHVETIKHREIINLCGTCHNNVHVVLTALKNKRPVPHIGRILLAHATRGYLLYVQSMEPLQPRSEPL